MALDLDLAIATRARHAIADRVEELLGQSDGGFFAALLAVLSE